MQAPSNTLPISGVIPPSYTEASMWPGAHTRRVPEGFVVLHGKREMWFDINGRYSHHMYHGPIQTTAHQWNGGPRYSGGDARTAVDHGLARTPYDSPALDAWNKTHGGTGQDEEVSPHIYRGHSWAWAVNEIHQDRWGSFVAKMADGAQVSSQTLADLESTIKKQYPERMRRDEMASFNNRSDYYVEPPSWVGQTTTYEKQRRAAEKRKRDQFGRFLPEDEPELDFNQIAAQEREEARLRRSRLLADQMLTSHDHNVRNMVHHMDPGPVPKLTPKLKRKPREDTDLERWTIRVALGGKNMTDFARELRLSDFGLYADAKAYDTQADEWDVTIRGGKDAFDRWFAEMRKEK